MKISGFMIPAEKVVSCKISDTLKVALDAMVEKKVGAIVVLDDSSDAKKALGILTKSDFLEAYQKELYLGTPVEKLMSKHLLCLKQNMPKDEAAKFFEKSKLHHAIVTNDEGEFVGIISSWDISAETANENRAWPWIRSEDGRFHHPTKDTSASPDSPTSVRRESHAFLDYIDSIRETPFMDD